MHTDKRYSIKTLVVMWVGDFVSSDCERLANNITTTTKTTTTALPIGCQLALEDLDFVDRGILIQALEPRR